MKKEAKTFANKHACRHRANGKLAKVFGSFFKKELLASPETQYQPAALSTRLVAPPDTPKRTIDGKLGYQLLALAPSSAATAAFSR